jgi:hypothetical protein
MRTCIERAREAGNWRVRLDTRTSMKSAQRLYERLGFVRAPEHDWSPAPGISLVAYVLELDEEKGPTVSVRRPEFRASGGGIAGAGSAVIRP